MARPFPGRRADPGAISTYGDWHIGRQGSGLEADFQHSTFYYYGLLAPVYPGDFA